MGWAKPYLDMISECEEHESRLSDWERGLLDSVRHRLDNDEVPTAKQLEYLNRIYDKVII